MAFGGHRESGVSTERVAHRWCACASRDIPSLSCERIPAFRLLLGSIRFATIITEFPLVLAAIPFHLTFKHKVRLPCKNGGQFLIPYLKAQCLRAETKQFRGLFESQDGVISHFHGLIVTDGGTLLLFYPLIGYNRCAVVLLGDDLLCRPAIDVNVQACYPNGCQ